MCGLLGIIGPRWRDHADAALRCIDTRGPDERSAVVSGDAWLGHVRLAIIDLAGGHQPMASPDGRHSVVFNGEIYNFAELREALIAAGQTFATRSDTEVLLHGYRHWGAGLLDRLDGMFAFAIWDAATGTLFAARDRMGIKPLFYARVDGQFVFASTLAPLLALPGFPRRLDPEALRDYLAFQTVLAPRSLVADVRQLPPAHQLEYRHANGHLDVRPFWDIPGPDDAPLPERESRIEQVDAAIRESVRRQLVADVPLGAFLSGGVDSSLMVHYMAEAGAGPVRTFSMRFAEAGFDESDAALTVAQQYATEHTVIDAPDIDGDAFLATLRELDQPLADPAYVTTAALSRETRRAVTVAVSGDGGDELFAGYARFGVQESDFPDTPGRRRLRALVRAGMAPGALLRRGLAGQEMLLYRQVELGPFDPSRKGLGRYLVADLLARAHPENTLERWRGLANRFGGGTLDTAALMRADLWTYLSENCLTKTDRASMAHSLEIRVPLLGNPVLDTVLGWPAEAHYDDPATRTGGKALLRALAQRHLPEIVWNRPKHGFSVPLQALFQGPWQAACEHYVSRCASIAPFLDAQAVQTLWRRAREGKASRRLAYTFVVLLVWLDANPLDL